MKRLGIAVVALAVTAGLAVSPAASVGGPTAAPTADAAKKKCKKKLKKSLIPRKCKKKDVTNTLVPPPVTPAATPAPAQASIALRCVDCAPYMGNPVARMENSNITFAGSISPAGPGTVVFEYAVGRATPRIQETIPVDATGSFSKTFTLNNNDTYTNLVTASFAGDANRTAAFAALQFYVWGA